MTRQSRGKRDLLTMKDLAGRLGLQYAALVPRDALPDGPVPPPVARAEDAGRSAFVHGTWRGMEVMAFRWEFTETRLSGGDRSEHDSYCICAATKVGGSFPVITITPRRPDFRLPFRIGRLFRGEPRPPAFDHVYRVQPADPTNTSGVLTERLMDWLLTTPYMAWFGFVVKGPYVMCYCAQMRTEHLESLLETLGDSRTIFPADGSASGRAPMGR